MAFGRTCLLGDAAFVVRPHTAGATAKAASDAMEPGRTASPRSPTICRARSAAIRTLASRRGRLMSGYGVRLGRRSIGGHQEAS